MFVAVVLLLVLVVVVVVVVVDVSIVKISCKKKSCLKIWKIVGPSKPKSLDGHDCDYQSLNEGPKCNTPSYQTKGGGAIIFNLKICGADFGP